MLFDPNYLFGDGQNPSERKESKTIRETDKGGRVVDEFDERMRDSVRFCQSEAVPLFKAVSREERGGMCRHQVIP